MTIFNYTRVKITIDDHEQEALDETISLLHEIWSSALENSEFEKDVYDMYIALSDFRSSAETDSYGSLYWADEIEITE